MNELAKISFYKDCFSPVPGSHILLSDFYNSVINGDYATEIFTIRSNPDKAAELKKKLPGVTISGTFSHREEKSLILHSGRICIDIDAKMNPTITDWELLRDTLGTWESVEFVALSSSGKGVFVVIVIRYPEKHLQHFLALERTFKKYGLIVDPNCKDVSRLRFMTDDKGAVINKNVTEYRILYEEPKRRLTPHRNSKDDLGAVINEIVSKRLDITNSYKNWYEIGCALANELGERGRDDFHRLSQIYSGYKQKECDRQYSACLKNPKRYSRATIFYYKKQLTNE
jgi:hypothetical protein